MSYITPDERRRMKSGLCFVCWKPIPEGKARTWGKLGIRVHEGDCNLRVKQSIRPFAKNGVILDAIRGVPSTPRAPKTIEDFWAICNFRDDAWTTGDALWRAYLQCVSSWAHPMSRDKFFRALVDKGLKETQNTWGTWGWLGIELKAGAAKGPREEAETLMKTSLALPTEAH